MLTNRVRRDGGVVGEGKMCVETTSDITNDGLRVTYNTSRRKITINKGCSSHIKGYINLN